MSTVKRKCRVVMLPTEKASFLYERTDLNTLHLGDDIVYNHDQLRVNRHLYILSDDEIKEGDWYIHKQVSELRVVQCVGIHIPMGAKKIIATTDTVGVVDKQLSKSMGGDVERRLPQPSDSFIQKFIEAYNNGKPIENVMVDYEKSTYDDWIKTGEAQPEFKLKVNSKDNTNSISKVKDSWSREEIVELLNKLYYTDLHEVGGKFDKWIEENL